MTWSAYGCGGGANMALPCAAQKLLCADAVALAYPQNVAEAPMMEKLKPLKAARPLWILCATGNFHVTPCRSGANTGA